MPGELPGGCRIEASDRSHGDLGGRTGGDKSDRRRAFVDLSWSTVEQVHGRGVVVVDAPSSAAGQRQGDALVTSTARHCLAVFGADCPLVGFASAEGVIGVAHAGWRGLVAGVLEETVRVLRENGATHLVARVGPAIGPECYEFGAADLDVLAARFGDGVRSATATGRPALDLGAAVRVALSACDVSDIADLAGCTACDDRYFSHRARGELGRHALVAWKER